MALINLRKHGYGQRQLEHTLHRVVVAVVDCEAVGAIKVKHGYPYCGFRCVDEPGDLRLKGLSGLCGGCNGRGYEAEGNDDAFHAR